MSGPAPDYAAIARMEHALYGRVFRHDGAPDPAHWNWLTIRLDTGRLRLPGDWPEKEAGESG